MEPPRERGSKVCINGAGHMTKMAAMPIYGKDLQSSSPEPLKLGMQHQGLKLYKVYINDDPGLTLTYFTASKFGCLCILIWKSVTSHLIKKNKKMTKLMEDICFFKINLTPWGCSRPLAYIDVYDHYVQSILL